MAASESLSARPRYLATASPFLYQSIAIANRVASRIGFSLASWWFGISVVVAWVFGLQVSQFDRDMGMTADLCNKATQMGRISLIGRPKPKCGGGLRIQDKTRESGRKLAWPTNDRIANRTAYPTDTSTNFNKLTLLDWQHELKTQEYVRCAVALKQWAGTSLEELKKMSEEEVEALSRIVKEYRQSRIPLGKVTKMGNQTGHPKTNCLLPFIQLTHLTA